MAKLLRLLAFTLALAPTAALAEPPVWVVRDRDSTIVLFGSVHILPKGVEWQPKPLTRALKKADDVWFEIPIDDATRLAAAQSAMKRAMLPAGVTLKSVLDADTWARLERVSAKLNIAAGALLPLRPWMAELTLSQAFMDQSGALVSEGVEQVISKEVPKAAKRRAFETPEQQLALYGDAPMADQIAMLKDTLDTIEADPKSFDDIVGFWMKPDLKGLLDEAVEPLRDTSPYLYKALVVNRNADWVKQIKQRLQGAGDTVMVVGVGHLVGPDSVPAMLRAQGIRVEGP